MGKLFITNQFLMTAGVSCALWFALIITPSASAAGPTGCPASINSLKTPTCTKEKNCTECKAAVQKADGEAAKSFDKLVNDCETIQKLCAAKAALPPAITASAEKNEFLNELATNPASWFERVSNLLSPRAFALDNLEAMKAAALKSKDAADCKRQVSAIADNAAKEADKCAEDIQKACKGISSGEKEGEKCKKAKTDAEKKAKDAADKAKEMDKNANKGEDNAKKEGGGMPQMPQIPQMPQEQKEDTPQDLATSPTPDSTVASSTAPQIETSKFDDGKSDLATPQIGFGGGTNTNTHVGLTPNEAFPVQSYASDNIFRAPSTNGLGENGSPSTVAASSPAGGGGGGAGGSGNTSGSSRPGEGGDTAKGPDAANPYEVAVGSGGRLGVPKGKSSTDADSPIDAAATANFNGDFKVDPQAGEQTAGAPEEEDPGYTIFKMVKYRYSELKKKGNI